MQKRQGAYCGGLLAFCGVSADCLPKQTRVTDSCLHGAPAGEPQVSASADFETHMPSGPRQPGPPLQPQPLQRQASSAKAADVAATKNKPRTKPIVARIGPSLITCMMPRRAANVHVLF